MPVSVPPWVATTRLFRAQLRAASTWVTGLTGVWLAPWQSGVSPPAAEPARPPSQAGSQATPDLEEFASVVTHDLRNPLTLALGHLELARASRDQDSEHLAAVDDALAQLEERIADLETLAHHGWTSNEPERVDLASVAKANWHAVETTDADLVINGTRPLTADPTQLRLLFENLFQNAVVHGGPYVTVRVGVLADGLYVEDDGPGIAAAEPSRVFQAGYSTASNGTGYGLHIVKAVVEAHGWEITVGEGQTGGTRFEITTGSPDAPS